MILKTREVSSCDHLITPDENFEITLDSPALDIFTDFNKITPLYIEQSMNLVAAQDLMRKTHVKLQLVLENGEFMGALSYEDLISEKAMAYTNHRPRAEIMVSEIMTPKKCLKAIEYEDVKQAKISDIIETLKNEKRRHFLVIDSIKHHIRGMFSASDIARRLHILINIDRVSTFIDIYNALKK